MSCRFGKGKAVPLQAWSGPEGSRKLRFPDFMTVAQDGGKVPIDFVDINLQVRGSFLCIILSIVYVNILT